MWPEDETRKPRAKLNSCVFVSVSERMCVCVDVSYSLSARLPFGCAHSYHFVCLLLIQ